MELGEELAVDLVLALDELDGPTLTHLGQMLSLTASSCNPLSGKRRREEMSKLWGNKCKLVDMLNKVYPSTWDLCSREM